MEETLREQPGEIASIDLFIRVKPMSHLEKEDKKVVHFDLVQRIGACVENSQRDLCTNDSKNVPKIRFRLYL